VVADDDPGFRQVLKSMLDGIAERIIEAGDGAQALEVVRAEPVDLVLADLGMPAMDGHTLLDRLPARIPAIVITGLDVAKPRRAAALLLKDDLTRERLAFAIARVARVPR
jgi:CheY-like chemotaxis protein